MRTVFFVFLDLSLEDYELICVYISPNLPQEEYKRYVDRIVHEVRNCGRETIIAGDINAKSPLWGSPKEDKRGEY